MARGNVQPIPTGTQTLQRTLNAEVRNAIRVLNPNDGIVYVAINGQASPVTFDFVVPSQSYAALPGPWMEYGLYFLDQSGAGRTGIVTVYESDERLDYPDYHAIGRSLQAQVTTVDITQGPLPPNPPIGVERIWADSNGVLFDLLSNGVNSRILDLSATGIIPASLLNFTPAGQLIGNVVVGATALASITFSSIPQTFKHLLAVGSTRDTNPVGRANVYFQFNGDPSPAYNGWNIYCNNFGGPAPLTNNGLAQTVGDAGDHPGSIAGNDANAFGTWFVLLPNYAAQFVRHSWVGMSGHSDVNPPSATSAWLFLKTGWYINDNAITQVAFACWTAFAPKSTISLYGLP